MDRQRILERINQMNNPVPATVLGLLSHNMTLSESLKADLDDQSTIRGLKLAKARLRAKSLLKVWVAQFLIVLLFTILVVFDGGATRNGCELVGTCECGKELKIWYYIYSAATSVNFSLQCFLFYQLS